jgi:hypothetical protein
MTELSEPGSESVPHLPRTPEANDYFLLAGQAIERTPPPRSAAELYAHTASSMMAIGIMQAGAIQRRLAESSLVADRTSDSVLFGNATGQGTTDAGHAITTGGIAEAAVGHNVDDYGDYYSFPLPVPGITGQYSERRDESGAIHGVVQVQPPIAMPDFPEDESFSPAEIRAALDRYQAELADNVEYVWDSMDPERVRLHRGTSSVELSELSLGQLLGSARLLRRVAITTALISNNHAILSQLLPPEQEVPRGRAPLSVAKALQEEHGRSPQPQLSPEREGEQ